MALDGCSILGSNAGFDLLKPGNKLQHLFEELALAGLLGGKAQVEVSLLHGPGCRCTHHTCESTCVCDLG